MSEKRKKKTSGDHFSLSLSSITYAHEGAESSCWSDQTLLVTVGGIVRVYVCNVCALLVFPWPL